MGPSGGVSVGRARVRGETQGFMKVLVDAETTKILGVGILGIGGDEVVHAFLDVMYARSALYGDHARHAYPPDGRNTCRRYSETFEPLK